MKMDNNIKERKIHASLSYSTFRPIGFNRSDLGSKNINAIFRARKFCCDDSIPEYLQKGPKIRTICIELIG